MGPIGCLWPQCPLPSQPLELGTQAPGETRVGSGRLGSWPLDLSLCGRMGLARGKHLRLGPSASLVPEPLSFSLQMIPPFPPDSRLCSLSSADY